MNMLLFDKHLINAINDIYYTVFCTIYINYFILISKELKVCKSFWPDNISIYIKLSGNS
jgi:hypothetical protein